MGDVRQHELAKAYEETHNLKQLFTQWHDKAKRKRFKKQLQCILEPEPATSIQVGQSGVQGSVHDGDTETESAPSHVVAHGSQTEEVGVQTLTQQMEEAMGTQLFTVVGPQTYCSDGSPTSAVIMQDTINKVLMRKSRWQFSRFLNNWFGYGNNRHMTVTADGILSPMVQAILDFEPDGDDNENGVAVYQQSLRERVNAGNRKMPRYLKFTLDQVHSKWPLLTKTAANEKMVHKFISDNMSSHGVRKRDIAALLPFAVMLSFVPTRAMLEAQEMEASMFVQDSTRMYKRGVVAFDGTVVRPCATD